MSQGGAKHSRDIKEIAKNLHEKDFSLAMNDVQIKFECHQRAVSATTVFDKIGEVEKTTPAPVEDQLAYAKQLYAWVTEVFEEKVL